MGDKATRIVLSRTKGFSLLEVLLALAIMASVIAVLMGTMSQSGQQSIYSSNLTQASLLARSKMVDLEYVVMEEGFSTAERTYGGYFDDEGFPEFRWEARIEPIEIPPDAQEEFTAQVNSQLFGGMEPDGGALSGNAAFSAMLPMLMGQLPEFVNQIGERVRRITLTVYFEFVGRDIPVEITHYVVDVEQGEFHMFGMPDDFDEMDMEFDE